ncbi:hypothetical protein ACSQ67_024112 [Phaseolus vulgaris]
MVGPPLDNVWMEAVEVLASWMVGSLSTLHTSSIAGGPSGYVLEVTISSENGEMETCEELKSIIESQIQANEALTSPKAKSDSGPQKGEGGISQNAKNQREVNFESSERKRVNGKERKNASH